MVACTPRSMDLFLRLAVTCHLFKDRAAMRIFGNGTIGVPQTDIWMRFYETQDLVPADEFLKKPSLFVPDPKRGDRTFAQMTAMSLYVKAMCTKGSGKSAKEQREIWDGGWDAIGYIVDDCNEGEDLAGVAAQELWTCAPKGGLLSKHEKLVTRFAYLTSANLVYNDTNAN